jgi:hypothetical protein
LVSKNKSLIYSLMRLADEWFPQLPRHTLVRFNDGQQTNHNFMKTYFASKTLIALAVALAAAAAYETDASEQPMPPPANSGALPSGIEPGTPAAEVVKLAQAGVDAGVVKNYINNSPSAFNLGADTIISLTDAGVSSDLVNAMMAHDKNLSANAPAPATASASAATENVSTAQPPAEVTMNYFNDTLSPYGSWVEVDGYGRCWRPTAVVYDSTWQPYCDRGHWVWTDCGWYWESDYSWGITFHYGRWFRDARFGWCWWPDTTWAPSWVVWRSCDDYCGWAPLPPFTVYEPGFGFYYRGSGVTAGFDFGLAPTCFTFVSVNNFCAPQPRYFCASPVQVTAIFNRTTIINNFSINNRTLVNNGVSITVIGAAAHHPIQPVRVGSMLNAASHGWRGEGWNSHPSSPGIRHFGASTATVPSTTSPGIGETHRQPVWNNDNNHNGESHNPFSTSGNSGNNGNNGGHRPPFTLPATPAHSGDTRSGEFNLPAHSQPNQNQNQNQTFPTPGKHLDPQHPSGFNGRSFDNNQAFNNPAPAAHSGNTYIGQWPASRQPAAPEIREQSRQISSPPVFNSPVASERPQHFETRQTYQPAMPHAAAPSYSAPAAAQSANGKLPNWLSQNH